MLTLITLLSLVATTPATAEVTATRLDGSTLTGQLERCDGSGVGISTPAGPHAIALDQLLSLRWSPAPPTPSAGVALPPIVELVDGTVLPIDDFRRQGDSATVTLRTTIPDQPGNRKSLTIPNRLIAAVRLQPLAGDLSTQWDEIRSHQPAGDVLVLLKRAGKSLDSLEGNLGDVDVERVAFEYDDQQARVARAKTAGLIFYRPAAESPRAEPVSILHGRGGLRANAVKVVFAGGMFRITTPADAEFDWPLDDIYLADFSSGKVLYLSDLEPAAQQRTPLVPLPAAARLAVDYLRPRRDQSAFGGPLTLRFPGSDWPAVAGQTRSYAKGLAVRSRTELVYRLPAGYTRLVGLAGVEPVSSNIGSVRLAIFGDHRPLVEAQLTGSQEPLPIDADVTGIKRLRILVDFGQNLDTGDWLNLCDLRIVK